MKMVKMVWMDGMDKERVARQCNQSLRWNPGSGKGKIGRQDFIGFK